MDLLNTESQVFGWEDWLSKDAFSNLLEVVGDFFESTDVAETILEQFSLSLQSFAGDAEFVSKMESVFGEGNDYSQLKESFTSGEFESFPSFEILSGAELSGANAAYAAATNTIYLAEDFLRESAGDVEAINGVLLEEFGHYVDAQVNVVDTPGDEGEYFSNVVQGVDLSESQVEVLQSENDSVVVNLGGISFEVEQSSTIPLNFASDFNGHKLLETVIKQRGETKALFMNGILTEDSFGMFSDQYEAVSKKLKITPSDPLSSIKFDYEYNPSALPSVSELVTSIGVGIAGAIVTGGTLTVAAIKSAILRVVAGVAIDAGEALYQIVSDDVTVSNWVNEKDGGLNDRVRDWINVENNSLIFLPHSQGNLFIEDSLKVVNPEPDITRIVALGSPTDYSSAGGIDSIKGSEYSSGSKYKGANIKNHGDPMTFFQHHTDPDEVTIKDQYATAIITDAVTAAIAIATGGGALTLIAVENLLGMLTGGSFDLDRLVSLITPSIRNSSPEIYSFLAGVGGITHRPWDLLDAHDLNNRYVNNPEFKSSFQTFAYQLQSTGYYFPEGKESLSEGADGYGDDDKDNWLEGTEDLEDPDYLDGKGRNDVIWGNGGNDTLIGGKGYDFIDGGSGIDEADYSSSSGGITVKAGLFNSQNIYRVEDGFGYDDLTDPESGGFGYQDILGLVEKIKGSAHSDEMYGGDYSDVFKGEGGVDRLHGGGNNDELHGGDEGDHLYGDADNDKLWGDEGNDELHGGNGEDELRGGSDNDTLYGNNDNDELWGDAGVDTLEGGLGDDTLHGG
ncbi:MAG: calcium-binding protein, partial [Spirulinaceae cyanobacterium]